MQKDIICKNIEDLAPVAQKLLSTYPNDRIFAFSGDLGVGKTTFIKILCQILGVTDVTNSPTFAIINEYHSEQHGMIYHFDLYRLKNVEELYDIGYEEYFYSGSYCFIEWPEIAGDLLPDGYIHVNIQYCSDNNFRRINFYKKTSRT